MATSDPMKPTTATEIESTIARSAWALARIRKEHRRGRRLLAATHLEQVMEALDAAHDAMLMERG